MNTEEEPRKLRPTQIAVLVVTVLLMVSTAASFGFGLHIYLNPTVDSEDGTFWSQVFGVFLMIFALFPAAGAWAMWLLWNDLARRVPGSALHEKEGSWQPRSVRDETGSEKDADA